MEERAFHPLDYLSVVSRRKWWLIVPVVLGVDRRRPLAHAVAEGVHLARRKSASPPPTLSPELLRGVSSLDKEERQRAISQQLLSRQVLERVVREEKLDPSKPVEDVAGWLRSRVVVQVDQPIGRMENKNGIDSFDLGYIDSRAEPRPAHHQPPRVCVRRGELEDADQPRREHLGGARAAAAGQPGAADRSSRSSCG